MKARDVIPGWPRGRSTTCKDRNCWWKDFDTRGRVLSCWFYPVSFMTKNSIRDLLLDCAYHQRQARMVEEYRRVQLSYNFRASC